jgi:hypothetical protein
MNPHWEGFADELFWFVDRHQIEAGPLQPPGAWRASTGVASQFPTLTRLLSSAHVTDVRIDGLAHVLFSWEPREGECRSWLAKPPEPAPAANLFPAHRLLLQSFGGIIERSNEPEGSWLLNLNDALTTAEATHDASFIADASVFDRLGIAIPIDLQAYYSIAREANGNDTLCHRVNGDVLLFAQDHGFKHLVPLEGCPDYTLYRIKGAPTFDAWVESVATQWSQQP